MMKHLENYSLHLGNPELTRNFWQELTPHRLIAIPIILGLIVMLINASVRSNAGQVLMGVGSTGFLFVAVFWGMKLASDSLIQEYSEGTWDSQRMSGLLPMQMVWGKLLGSTVMAWYAGLMLLCLFIWGAFSANESLNPGLVIKLALCMVVFAVTMHAMCMASLLALWRKRDRQLSKNMRGTTIGLALIAVWFGSAVMPFTGMGFYRASRGEEPAIAWFGLEISLSSILLVTAVCMMAWMLISVWQLMRSELQFRNRPWWWLGFLLFWMFYLAGFVNEDWVFKGRLGNPWLSYLLGCFLCIVLTVYMQLFFARKDAMTWLRFSTAFKRRDWGKLSNLFPAWGTSYLVAMVVGVILLVWTMVMPFAGSGYYSAANLTLGTVLLVVSTLLFVLRDIALVLWLNLAEKNRRADAAAVMYLVVLYMLLPWLLISMTSPKARFLFLPIFEGLYSDVSVLYLLSPLLQAAIMVGLVLDRWKSRKGHILNG
ncbi:hypothetical protein [Saezia sanguinis]|uniref:hypothetical protein n=1 Tax=Saezia sanguinis TaxID=1965230 RepID=UPI0030561D0B